MEKAIHSLNPTLEGPPGGPESTAAPSPPSAAGPSHDRTTFGFLLLKSGRNELRPAGKTEKSLGKTSGRALGGHWEARLGEAEGRHCPEDAVDALL